MNKIKSFLLKTKTFIINLLIGIDQLGNVLMLGDPDETISSRAGRVWPNTWWTWFIDYLFFWQTNHCHKSIEPSEGKRDILFPRTEYPFSKKLIKQSKQQSL